MVSGIKTSVLSHRHITQYKIICASHLDDCDQEPLLVLLVHRPADGADGPAEHVQIPPRPLGAVHLVVELLCHDAFGVGIIQMGQIH